MDPLFVSKPLLPQLKDVYSCIDKIWSSGHVTNHGPLSLELEARLANVLDAPTAMLFNNGTAGLFAALKYFDLPPGSEVITTPMTFAATAHAISWNNLHPVFVDVTERDLTIDPEAVSAAITSKTSAILAVHAYGCICDHAALDRIAKQNNLKLIYDAAHAFGATLDGQSVATLGDASIFSFHATKLFNTIEGGLITTPRVEDREGIYLLRNFGIKSEEEVVSIGLNGKMNELQAAIGLLNLDIFEQERAARAQLRARYKEILAGLNGVLVQDVGQNATQSEQYFLTRIDKEKFGRSRDDIKAELEKENIFCRKYFFPLCTDYTPYQSHSIVTNRDGIYAEIAKMQVLCLPFHSSVQEQHLKIIERVFRRQ
jgi:dTDP-4-amino-4,6-dideoxygalactose transaminase